MRRSALATLFCLSGFAGLIAISMRLYPGGNWLDRSAPGHRFWFNFWCDLTQPVSLSGVDNHVGAFYGELGMLCFAASLAGFFWLLPRQFARQASSSPWVRGFGECAVLIFVAVTLMPSERFGALHAYLALASGGFGILAAACAVVSLWRSHTRARRLSVLGGLVLVLGAFDALVFLHHLNDAAPPPLVIPAVQKIAGLLLSAWIIAVAWLEIAVQPSTRRPGSG